MLALGLAASVAFLGDASAHRDGVGVWGPSRGPEGGWVTTVAVAPSETVYAGTYFGRLFKSVDGARTWHAVDSWVDSRITALVIDPQDPDVVYAAAVAGFFKSADAGGSWRLVTADMRDPQTLAVDPQTPATMYAGTFDGGVLKTTNGGASWVPTNAGLTDRDVLALAIDPATRRVRKLVRASFLGGFTRGSGLPPAAYGRAPELTFVRFRSHLHPWRSRPGTRYVVRIRVSRARANTRSGLKGASFACCSKSDAIARWR